MKKLSFLFPLLLVLSACGGNSSSITSEGITITDAVGRAVKVMPGSYKRIVCIGAGALRAYTYVGDVNLLSGVEDIDNESLESRPKMFDGVARPYVLANAETFKKLPSCGVGGPNAQAAEEEKILSCNPDLIFSEYEDADKANALASKIGCPVVVLSMGNENKFYGTLANIGAIMGKDARSKELVDYHKAALKEISDKTAGVTEAEQKKTYICGLGNWGTTNQLMTAQNYNAFNVAHIKNVVSGLPKDGIQAIDEEKFASLAPQMEVMIFDAAAVKNIRGKGIDFSQCAAFQSGEVYLQMAYNAYYTNFETALISNYYIAAISYPRLFAGFDIEAKANEITKKFNGVELYNQIKAKPQSFGGYQKIANPTEFFQ